MSDNEGPSELSITNSRILDNLHNEVHREKEPQKASSNDDSELDAEGDSDDEIDAQGDNKDDEIDNVQDAQLSFGDSQAAQVLEDEVQLAQGDNNADGVEEGRQNKERDEPRRKGSKNILSDITKANIIGRQLRHRQSPPNEPAKKESPNGRQTKALPKKTAVKKPVKKPRPMPNAPHVTSRPAQGNRRTRPVQDDDDTINEARGRLCDNIAGLLRNGVDVYYEFVDYTTLRDGENVATTVESVLAGAAGRRVRSVTVRRNDRAKRRRLNDGDS